MYFLVNELINHNAAGRAATGSVGYPKYQEGVMRPILGRGDCP